MADLVQQQGGAPLAPGVSVYRDDTLIGNGTKDDPLGVAGAGSAGFTFDAQVSGFLGASGFRKGCAAKSVAGSFARSVNVCGISSTVQCVGLNISPTTHTDATVVTIQNTGIVELTTAEWDTVTGQSGGLTPGAIYYVDAANGSLTVTPSTNRVGSALNATEMLLALWGE